VIAKTLIALELSLLQPSIGFTRATGAAVARYPPTSQAGSGLRTNGTTTSGSTPLESELVA